MRRATLIAMTAFRFAVVVLFLVTACGNPPPPGWQQGGAPLVIDRMSWMTAGGRRINVAQDGQVTIHGHLIFSIDRAGRVYDHDNEPVALLLPDGTLEGSGGTELGHVGVTNAAPPRASYAWLTVLPDGQVLHFAPDGTRTPGGYWRGCDGPQHRACTLVSHLLSLHRIAVKHRYRSYKYPNDNLE